MTVGLIGIGAMGLGIAEHLIRTGKTVVGFRRTPDPRFAEIGGVLAPDPAAVGMAAKIVLLVLPNEEALAEVIEKLTPVCGPEHVVICLSSQSVDAKRQAAKQIARNGAIMLDGELSGTPEMMRAREATAMIAGDAQALNRVGGTLASFAKSVTEFPLFGDAAWTKLITNYLVAVHTAAAAEALAMAEAMGLDPELTLKAIVPSAGGSRMLMVRGTMMARHDYPPGNIAGFKRYLLRLRQAVGEPGPGKESFLDLTEAHFDRAVRQGLGHLDIAALRESAWHE